MSDAWWSLILTSLLIGGMLAWSRLWNWRDRMKRFAIEWDNDYGINHRRGWSVVYDGSVVVQFEPHLIVAVWKAWRCVRQWESVDDLA